MSNGMYLSKYPVISKRGNEYMVTIKSDTIYSNSVVVSVFVKRKTRFGRECLVLVNNTTIGRNIYREDDWNYDYITIAKAEVEDYEEKKIAKDRRESKRKESAKLFEEWDGVIR